MTTANEEMLLKIEKRQAEAASIIEEAVIYRPKSIKPKLEKQEDVWEKPRTSSSVYTVLRKAKDNNIVGNPHFEKKFIESDDPFVMGEYARCVLKARWPSFEKWVKDKFEKNSENMCKYWVSSYVKDVFKVGDVWPWLEEKIDVLDYKKEIDEGFLKVVETYVIKTKLKKDLVVDFFVNRAIHYLVKIIRVEGSRGLQEDENYDNFCKFRYAMLCLNEFEVHRSEKIEKFIKIALKKFEQLSSFSREMYSRYNRSSTGGLDRSVFSLINWYDSSLGIVLQKYYLKQDKENNDFYNFLNQKYINNIAELFLYCGAIGKRMSEEKEKYLLTQMQEAFETGYADHLERLDNSWGYYGSIMGSDGRDAVVAYVVNCIKGRWEAFEDLTVKYCDIKGAKEYAKAIKQIKKDGTYQSENKT